jgi:hypothetical protein
MAQSFHQHGHSERIEHFKKFGHLAQGDGVDAVVDQGLL